MSSSTSLRLIGIDALRRYARAYSLTDGGTARARARAAGRDLRLRNEAEAAIAALDAVALANDVSSVGILVEKALAFRDLGRSRSSDDSYRAASRRALTLGWIRASQSALRPVVHRHAFLTFKTQRPAAPPEGGTTRIRGLQRLLHDGEVVVRLFRVGKDLLALIFDRDSSWFVDLGNPRVDFITELPRVGGATVFPIKRWERDLVGPLKLRPEHRRIFAVIDDSLAGIPFAAATELEVVLLPTFFDALRSRKPPTASGILAGFELAKEDIGSPGTVILHGRPPTYAGFQAMLAKRWRAIHLTCPLSIDRKYPFRRLLRFADQEVRLREIASTGLKADLLVLAADMTGVIRVGSRTVFTARGMLGPSCPRVLVHLWRKDPAASNALMTQFYAHWKEDTSAAAALRRAQKLVRSQPQWRAPFYWAGWQLWGNP